MANVKKSIRIVYDNAKDTGAFALTVSEMLTFQMFEPANLGQDHEIQRSQWPHSIANVQFYECCSVHFYFVAFTVSESF